MRRFPGFTLAEMLISLVVVGVIVVGLASTLVVTSQSLPGVSSAAASDEAATDASGALAQIAAELAYAIDVTVAEPAQIAFTVDEGGVVKTIRYAWNGTAGAPLTRQDGAKTAVTLVSNVQGFSLEYITEQTAGGAKAPLIESNETQLLQLDGTTLTGLVSNFDVSGNDRVAQRFRPSLPQEAISWRVTRVHLDLKNAAKKSNKDVFRVGVAPVTGAGRPGSMVDSVSMAPELIVDGAWNEFSFSNAGGLDPVKDYCVVVDSPGGGGQPLVKVKFNDLSTSTPSTTYFDDTGGGTWSENPDRDLYVWVWGTYSYPDPGFDPSGPAYITGVRLTLAINEPGADGATTVATLYNEPETPK